MLLKVAGFWATVGIEKRLGEEGTPAQRAKKRMSEPPSRPNLTPQFCFNQTALRGANSNLSPLMIVELRLSKGFCDRLPSRVTRADR